MFEVREIEKNSEGTRIMKVTETGKSAGGEFFTRNTYVVHFPSRLVKTPTRINGKFGPSVMKPARCAADVRTGWMVGETYQQLAVARAALGINTNCKKLAA